MLCTVTGDGEQTINQILKKEFHYCGCRIMAITSAFQAEDVSSILTIRSTNDERVIKRVSRGNTARIPQQIGRRKVNERQWRIGNSWGCNPN
jgi:aspartate aminotransferase-like enzyme